MEQKLLYVLTVKCTADSCEEDLEATVIDNTDDEAIYAGGKKYMKASLMEVEQIRADKEEMILRIPFVIKEAAIIWVREAFVLIQKNGTGEMYEAVKEEWRKIMHPKYDVHWFTGGKKVEEWREEMRLIADRL